MFRIAMQAHRYLLVASVIGALVACENRSRPKDTTANQGSGSALPTQPSPDPTPAADVAPPTAADLATYTKDLPGTGSKLMAKIETTMGTLTCELYGDKAPMTVANFVGLATGKKPWMGTDGKVQRDKPFFDGITFHRVIPEFMIQGGDPTASGRGGPGYAFDDEIWQGQHILPGVLAMANAGQQGGHGTNGSQFFVMEGERPDLDSKHTVFGKCAELDVVKKITHVKTESDKPIEDIKITKVTISKG